MSEAEPIPQTQFTHSGDIYLAYQVLGRGPITILFVGGFVSHLELLWEEPGQARFVRRLSQLARVILFDKRGIGLSDRVGSPPTVEDTMEDILVILNAVGCDRAALMGVSEGGPVAIMFAATYPNRTSHLLLYGTMPKWLRSYDYPWALSRNQYDKWLETMLENWGTGVSLAHFAPSRADDRKLRAWWAKVLRSSSTPGSIRSVLEVLRDIDVRPVLPHVHVPALVLHRTGDKAVPAAGGRFLAQNLPQAQFVSLSGQDHLWWLGDSAAILQEIKKFFEGTAVPESGPAPSTILEKLTGREMEVLQLIGAGYTNQQIADELILAVGTVKAYTSNIYGKLNVNNRTQAVSAARKMGLIR